LATIPAAFALLITWSAFAPMASSQSAAKREAEGIAWPSPMLCAGFLMVCKIDVLIYFLLTAMPIFIIRISAIISKFCILANQIQFMGGQLSRPTT
jgi:hypothetical protein